MRCRPSWRALCAALAMVVSGCDPEPKTVPFKRPDNGQAPASEDSAPDDSTGAPDEAPHADTALPEPTRHDDGPDHVTLAGSTVTIPGHAVLASLHVELSGDQLEDAMLLVRDGEQTLSLRTYVARASGALDAQPPLPLTEGACGASDATLQVLSSAHVAVKADLACKPRELSEAEAAAAADPTAAPPPAPDDHGLTVPATGWFVASLERAPRVLQRVRLVGGAAAEAPSDAALTMSLQGMDIDDDTHPDVRAELTLAGVGEPFSFALDWLDRPAGLGRDTGQPEARLAELATSAMKSVRKDPAAAEALADRVRTLHGLLCQGGEHPLLRIDGVAGLPCGRSEARGRASAARVAAQARAGRLLEALAALEALHDSPAQRVDERDREQAEAAVAAFPGIEDMHVRRGPAVSPALAPAVHAPRLRFVDEQHLLVLGSNLLSYDLGTDQLVPMAGDGSALVESPDGQLAVTAVVRRCDGYHLQVLSSTQVVAGVAAGKPVAEPLVTAAPGPGGGACKDPLPQALAEGHGHRVLRWGNDGIVVARGGDVVLLPVDGAGHATGAPTSLIGEAAGDARQRNLPGILGQRLPLSTRLGIALLDPRNGRVQLLPIQGSEGQLDDIAISPSGQRLGFLRAGALWIAQPQSTAPAPTPQPSAPSTATNAPPAPPEPMDPK